MVGFATRKDVADRSTRQGDPQTAVPYGFDELIGAGHTSFLLV